MSTSERMVPRDINVLRDASVDAFPIVLELRRFAVKNFSAHVNVAAKDFVDALPRALLALRSENNL